MKFLTNFIIILAVSYAFVSFGGSTFFDAYTHPFLSIAAYAFVITIIVSTFLSQDEKIEQLEKRIKELEEKENT